jgi:hypothetical protein
MSNPGLPVVGPWPPPRPRDLVPVTRAVRITDPGRLLDPRPRLADPLVDVVIAGRRELVLESGATGEPITVSLDALRPLLVRALGGLDSPVVVWQDGLAEVMVHLDRTQVAIRPGFVIVALVLESEQAGPADVTVVLAVGRVDGPAALLITAEALPHGPPELVDGWGRAVVAAAVTALVTVAADITAARGHDQRGLPLLPASIAADKEGLHIVPRARLEIEEAAR